MVVSDYHCFLMEIIEGQAKFNVVKSEREFTSTKENYFVVTFAMVCISLMLLVAERFPKALEKRFKAKLETKPRPLSDGNPIGYFCHSDTCSELYSLCGGKSHLHSDQTPLGF